MRKKSRQETMRLPSASHGGCRSAATATATAAADCLPSRKPALRRIDNSLNRQLTFSKRRNGLLRKAYELSVLCDAQVATLIFSSTGGLSEFSSPSMSKVIKRYQDLQPQTSNKVLLQEREYSKHESLELRKEVDYLNDVQSHIIGRDVMNLPVSELQKIESQLELTMKKIQKHKMELLEIQTQEVMSEGYMLWRENNLVKQKIARMMHNSDENPASCEMSGSSSTTTSELANGPPIKEVLETELKLEEA